MSPETPTTDRPETAPSHIRTREEVLAMEAAEARKRLAIRMGGVSIESTPNPTEGESAPALAERLENN